MKKQILGAVTLLTAIGGMVSIEAVAQYGRPGHGVPPQHGRCYMRGGRKLVIVNKQYDRFSRDNILNLRRVLELSPACRGLRMEEIRVVARATGYRRGWAELQLNIDYRRMGSERIRSSYGETVSFRLPSNDNELGEEVRRIELEVRGDVFVQSVELIADRNRGGYDDDTPGPGPGPRPDPRPNPQEDTYSNIPVRGIPTLLGSTGLTGLTSRSSVIETNRRSMMLKGLELKAKGDAYRIDNMTVVFFNGERLNLGTIVIPENQSIFVDFEGGRFRDVRAVDKVLVTGAQAFFFATKAELEVIGVEPRR